MFTRILGKEERSIINPVMDRISSNKNIGT